MTQILIKACQAFLKDSQSVDITFWDFYRSKKLGSQRCCQFILAPEIKQDLRAFILALKQPLAFTKSQDQ